MSPRRYSLGKRRSTVAETRQKIVEATVSLHGQKGIFGTSWQDIAREADVSVGTVYKHFPTLEELVPACGELLMERIRPPSADAIATILADAADRRERLRRVALELFAFYERGGPHLESDLRERALPAMKEWEDHLRRMVAGFVAEAIAVPDRSPARSEDAAAVAFLFDLPTFRAFRLRGIDIADAASMAADMGSCWLRRHARQDD